MVKNDFRVTSIVKIVLGFVRKFFEFLGKASKFLTKRCLLGTRLDVDSSILTLVNFLNWPVIV